MQETEEDEKQSVSAASEAHGGFTSAFGTFLYDERLVTAMRKIVEGRSEDLLKAIPTSFLEHIL
jgi:hypothetical protein